MPLRRLTFTALALLPLPLFAAPPLELDEVHIEERTTDTQVQAEEAMRQVPGGSNLIDAESITQARTSTMQDVLAYQPGIYAQSAGNEGIRLSIRGSGINRGSGGHGSGTFVLLDGLALSGPGGTPYELQEPLWIERAEVLRGANGLAKGALALGGAVDLITPTGLTAAPLTLRYEAGSYGWRKRHVSSGGHNEQADYFVALTDSDYDGYQDHASGSSQGVMANFGYRFNAQLETRFYLRYRETDHETPGRLTLEQIKHHPRMANPTFVARDSSRPQHGSTWLANKTTWRFDDGALLEAGLAYHDYPMDLHESVNRVKLAYSDVSTSLRYSKPHQLFGRNSQSSVALRATAFLPHSGASEYVRIAGTYPEGTHTRDYEHNGSDSVLQFSNDLELIPDLWLSSGLALIYTRREVQVTYPDGGEPLSLSTWDYAPHLGLRYQLSPELQLFGNLSRSVEAPHAWSMLWGSNDKFPAGSGPATGMIRTPVELENQTATTLELGGRGDSIVGTWDLSYYYSLVRHELLTVELTDGPTIYNAESNASPTVHQGIEAGLLSTLWQGRSGLLSLRQAYTFSDFHYRDDDVFGDNRLPGLPQHYYQAELRFQRPDGWFLALNTQLASRVAVDYANSRHAGSYKVFGASAGYHADDWQGWLELRNLTGERYAATITPGYNDQGRDMARATPGESFGVYSGLSYSWR
ncbi:TonB-dependent receptor [Pseudomonas sp. PDM14]|uniref:TonB-dependent receptor family protein n=1 Tax=Pseudomonas sp. PDM14 TaxID=2769288 RepID=UPI00177EA767|nr:TonB-dependent receptor [Pseudomonas sp. PDM14]MBD9483022.1 TonB-dependent receptor [Pseudomonas sp. PDM14]